MIAGTVIIADRINAQVIPLVKASCTATGMFAPPMTNMFIISSIEIVPMIRGKAIPMLSTMPALLKNALMDDATPRRCGDTDDIMALVFGGWNKPEPKLFMNIHTAIIQ
jgi:hypothetical protein